uniref:Histidine-rich glycoprotein (Fragments) n=1 Tax=Bos taurus TaxID=9913 RepID=Q9TS85_BOVIN
AVNPTGCDAVEPVAVRALDLINKVADAHLDKVESIAVYYLVLDVKESDCPVLSRKHWDDCELNVSRYPSETVIGQCKVIAITLLAGPEDLRTVGEYTEGANTRIIDSPVLFDFFEDTTLYGGEGTSYFLDFSVRNCSSHHFPRHSHIFGFCRADLFYDVEASDLETPKDIVTNCEVFNLKNFSAVQHHLGRPFHWGGHGNHRPPHDNSSDEHHN